MYHILADISHLTGFICSRQSCSPQLRAPSQCMAATTCRHIGNEDVIELSHCSTERACASYLSVKAERLGWLACCLVMSSKDWRRATFSCSRCCWLCTNESSRLRALMLRPVNLLQCTQVWVMRSTHNCTDNHHSLSHSVTCCFHEGHRAEHDHLSIGVK